MSTLHFNHSYCEDMVPPGNMARSDTWRGYTALWMADDAGVWSLREKEQPAQDAMEAGDAFGLVGGVW